MTDRQQAILRYLIRLRTHGEPPPTIREIAEECDISSTSVVVYNVEALQKAGFVQWHRFVSRGIIVVDKTPAGDLVAENAELTRKLRVAQIQISALRKQVAQLREAAR